MSAVSAVRLSLAFLASIILASCAPSGGVMRDEGASPDPVMGDWLVMS